MFETKQQRTAGKTIAHGKLIAVDRTLPISVTQNFLTRINALNYVI